MEGQVQDLSEAVHRADAWRDHQAEDAERLVEAGRRLASASDLPEFLGRLAEITPILLEVDLVQIWLRDHTARALVLRAQAGTRRTALQPDPAKGPPGWVVDCARSLAVPDARIEPRLGDPWFEAEGIIAFLGVPLFRDGAAVGALACMRRTQRHWSTEEVALAQTLAILAGVAVQNAQLQEEGRARLARMRRLTQLSHLVTSSLDLKQVLDFVSEAALDLLNGDLVRLWVVDEEAGVLRLRASAGRGDDLPAVVARQTQFPLGQGLVGWVMERKTNRYSPNLLEDPLQVNKEWVRAGGYVSQIAVPLVADERALGALMILTKAPRQFSQEEEELLNLFAAAAAVGLENARLFAATQAQAAALREKNAELDSFVSIVSHDLRAPLVTIQGMATVLLEEHRAKLDADGRHCVQRIQAGIQHMDRLLADLLTLSRIGKEAQSPEAVSLAELVDDLLVELAEPILARGIRVTGRNLGFVRAIRSQMEQVIGNLLGNAVKYMGDTPSPTVEIGTVDAGEFVRCYAKDNGIGIDPAYHERVFEIFQRLNPATAGGTGVGLAIVKKIVEAAGGRVWVESAKGHGATFSFTWPKEPGKRGPRWRGPSGSSSRGASAMPQAGPPRGEAR